MKKNCSMWLPLGQKWGSGLSGLLWKINEEEILYQASSGPRPNENLSTRLSLKDKWRRIGLPSLLWTKTEGELVYQASSKGSNSVCGEAYVEQFCSWGGSIDISKIWKMKNFKESFPRNLLHGPGRQNLLHFSSRGGLENKFSIFFFGGGIAK